jgi:hypothetical protein
MKTTMQLLLFAGAVALLGIIIRGINRNTGWYEANKLELTVDPPLDASRFRMYMAERFEWSGPDSVRQPFTYTQVLYDTAFVLEFPRVASENYLVLEYDSAWVFPFVHYKWNADGQHTYNIRLEMEDDSILTAGVEIDGPSSEYYYGEFTPKSDSLAHVIDYFGSHGEEMAPEVAEQDEAVVSESPDTLSVSRPGDKSSEITYENR